MEKVISVSGALSRVAAAMRRQAWDGAMTLGITPTQGEVLVRLLEQRTALRLGEIAEGMRLTTPTLSEAVKTLVEKGLVKKLRDREDARAVALSLTARGRNAAKRATAWHSHLDLVVQSLSTRERDALKKGLTALLQRI
ncbi:MarR family winged helix-turn-helix transcriptional regulator [Pandoraea aquatica]|uniref:MarR family winged helix-turn-helix transcriptional regulator n=1 Tax=Pandoraea aquatica TaxID=2508290 RepID=UPI0012411432|nr:MarR family transcriptional regulator [Pandoraea aquatica]